MLVVIAPVTYQLVTDGFTYRVERERDGETLVRCTHVESGVTAEKSGATQFIARTLARLRCQEIMGMEHIPGGRAVRPVGEDRAAA